ncbi:DUF6221 family protein [Arthrobacter sp. ISL-69]|uniref:DUF6221 family protein n=1 Tax=Arthrobacter sp. ISL-69 TaxID=2819113 RepID=UPI001BE9D16D|nr:DUF6221 family protein [Arthrobacter sp. ISL-69]MBT2537215.1 hypothetical protein [Arthrobacter sp. ISL-69]
MTITEFLLARIAEDEAAALPFRNDLGETKQWQCDEIGGAVRYVGPRPFGLPDLLATCGIHAEAAHIARHDPARVLAECAAKRAIIANSADAQPGYMDDRSWNGFSSCHDDALYALAAVYADHPEYRQEWAV